MATKLTLSTIFNEDAEYFAKWNLLSYTIDYNMGGHGNNPNTKTSYTVEESFTPSNPENPFGYRFTGWTP